MKIYKLATLIVAVCLIVGNAIAQENTRTEESVEGIYLETNEDLVIAQMAAVENYETKLLTLEYIQSAIDEGRSSPAIAATLQGLASEGVLSESRTAGRLDNNYTEVRRQASLMLANIPTEESKNTLVNLIAQEKEPMVLSAAIYALGEIGINENNEVVNQIATTHNRTSRVKPIDSIADSVLIALGKLATTGIDSSAAIETIADIAANYRYNRLTREKAQELLYNLK